MEVAAVVCLIIFLYWREQMESPINPDDPTTPTSSN